MEPVVHGVRTAIAAGGRTIVLTNAAGGLRPETQKVGEPVLISDHINLTGAQPGHRREVRRPHRGLLARGCATSPARWTRPSPRASTSPSAARTYETPAEIRMLRTLGGDLVGMSTVLEAIAAREGGAEVLGISLVTNPGAGLVGEPLDHEEVLEVGRATAAAWASCSPRWSTSCSGPSATGAAGDAEWRERNAMASDDVLDGPGPGVARPGPRPGDPGRAAGAARRRRPRRWPTGSAPSWSSAPPACAASSAPGPNRMNRVTVMRAAAGAAPRCSVPAGTS